MDIKQKLTLLPDKPGCYLMKDSKDEVIYVGKAKNLKNRVKSYFVGAHNEKTTLLISEIRDFSYLITNNELESLILEINLIKRYLPKYNIKLVDDKSYPYIKFSKGEYPRLIVMRSNTPTQKAFGPYPNGYSARMTVDLLNKLYPFRKCVTIPKKPCLYYHLGQCLAPCINDVSKEEYNQMIKEVTRFLKGDTKKVLDILEGNMYEASDNLEFEKANEYKEMINHINTTSEKQIISLADLKDRDIIAYAHNDENIAIQILLMRNGAITDTHQTIFSYIGDHYEAALNYIDQLYLDNLYIDELLFSNQFNLNDLEIRYKKKASIPQIGDKKKMVDLALQNAKENLENYFKIYQHREDINLEIERSLYELFSKEINYIEAFDNSQLFGSSPVSAMIVYKNHEFFKDGYRKFNIQTASQDDYQQIKEVIYRRYYRLLMEDKSLPDLILVDGGVGHVNAALSIIDDLRLDVMVAGMKKNKRHEFESLIFNGKEVELSKNSNLYKFFLKINEEVHRFAITFHRQVRFRETFKSPLDGIKGIGVKRKEKLINHFGTIEAIKEAKVEEIVKLGFSLKLAQKLKEELK
ncbi:MAG TPA: excinuclease ABC subunit UvrC [Acholeplasmataceae bacterium]|nr:excinuclease ABC subunit UvrC [Acholeplasmataceae bacterium]